MKNLPLILSIVALLGMGHLYYLHFAGAKTASGPVAIVPPPSASGGAKIAYVNGDTLDAKYEWLKERKEAINQRMENAQKSMAAKQEAFLRDMNSLQERFAQGNMTQADAEKEQAALLQRRDKIAAEAERLEKSLAEEQDKLYKDIYSDLEAKLKTLSDQIGYDYILSYSRGGQILLANDSLDITNEVLQLLNARDEEKK
ncbi:MAG: OmpH family outer membrane protein [Saprospiraceae bacterium]|nr:OmpH family outer membrane protein [Saprospiraceae bacterium]